jgi:hypothetical protein
MRVLRCAAVLLFFGFALGALPSVAAGAPRSESAFAEGRAAAGPAYLFDRIWGLLASVWSEAGCSLDPLGRCHTGTASGEDDALLADAGCTIDPLGRCRPRP